MKISQNIPEEAKKETVTQELILSAPANVKSNYITLDCFVSFSAAVVLLVICVAKLVTLLDPSERFYQEPNPLFSPLPNWIVTLCSCMLEGYIGVCLIKRKWNPRILGACLLWLVGVLSLYRFGMWFVSPHSDCNCFGLIGILMGSGKAIETKVAYSVLSWLAFCGVFLVRPRNYQPKPTSNIVILLFAIALNSYSARAGDIVQLSGEIRQDCTLPNGSLSTTISSFQIVRDGIGWQLVTHKETPKNLPADLLARVCYLSIASDGKTTYTLLETENKSPVSKVGYVDITDGQALFTECENIPWFFLIFDKGKASTIGDLVVPWCNARNELSAYFCTNIIQWSQSEPRLVSRAQFFYSRDRITNAFRGPFLTGKPVEPVSTLIDLQDLASIGENNLAGECFVEHWTNTAWGIFPSEFEVRVYNSLWNYKRHEVNLVRQRFVCLVKDIQKVSSISYTPKPTTEITTVYDNRLGNTTGRFGVRYGPIHEWITNVADVATNAFSVRKRSRVSEETKLNVRRWIRAGLVLTIFMPILFFAYSKKKQKNQ